MISGLKVGKSVSVLFSHTPIKESTVLPNVFGSRWNYSVSFAGASFIFGSWPFFFLNYVIPLGILLCTLPKFKLRGPIETFTFKIKWKLLSDT